MADKPYVPPSAQKASPARPNKWERARNDWHFHDVEEPTLVKSLETTPAVGYILPGEQRPTTTPIAADVQTIFPTKDGMGLFLYPGRWWVYWVGNVTNPGTEKYVTKPATKLDIILALLDFEGFIRNVDLKRWGGTALSAARDADADADFTKVDVGELANVRGSAFAPTLNDWTRLRALLPNGANAENSEYWLACLSALAGQDSTLTAGQRIKAIEARVGSAAAGFLGTMYGLLTNSRLAAFEPTSQSDWQRLMSIAEAGGASYAALVTQPYRESGYFTSRVGRRFVVGSQGNIIAGATAFSATAPQILIQAGATNELIGRRALVQNADADATPPVHIRWILDPDGRYSSGGTSRTPSNMNGGNATAATTAQCRDGAITATAADADEREIAHRLCQDVAPADPVEIDWKDGLVIPAGGTLLGYVYGTGGTAPDFVWEVEFEDANVQ